MKFAKKSLGQNFLIDKNIIKKVLNLTNFENRDVIEIGPGKAALTEEILKKKPKSLSIIEMDNNLANKLKNNYFKTKLVKVYNIDVLKLNLELLVKKNSIIIGNLPYNISSQILVKVLRFKKWPPLFKDLIFMFQKELGEKIIGKYSSPNYGRLSILSNYRLKMKKKFLISPNCFFPKPKVTSQIIHFQPKMTKTFTIKKIQNLEKITNVIFSNKRKMINKNIKKLINSKKLKKIPEINLNLRPSDIKPEIYYKITQLYEE
tara:strand:- start:65 stop:847 length:783 start_codon:yes stop_codon:yes gene_type:complete